MKPLKRVTRDVIEATAPLLSTEPAGLTIGMLASAVVGFSAREILGSVIVDLWRYFTDPLLSRFQARRIRRIRIRDLQRRQLELIQEVEQLRELAERVISQRDDYMNRWLISQRPNTLITTQETRDNQSEALPSGGTETAGQA